MSATETFLASIKLTVVDNFADVLFDLVKKAQLHVLKKDEVVIRQGESGTWSVL